MTGRDAYPENRSVRTICRAASNSIFSDSTQAATSQRDQSSGPPTAKAPQPTRGQMKAGREHRVPLPPRAIVILKKLAKLKQGDFVFEGQLRNKPLSGMAMHSMLRRMNIDDATVHGFRSSFRDWAGNVTNFPREITEMALSMSSAIKRNKLTDAVTLWINAASSWKRGPIIASQKPAAPSSN